MSTQQAIAASRDAPASARRSALLPAQPAHTWVSSVIGAMQASALSGRMAMERPVSHVTTVGMA